MEPIADCDMEFFLNKPALSQADVTCIRQAFGCLCAAIIYLQEKQCRHKDIKPRNILVKSGRIFITDFGIARDWSGKSKSITTGVIVECTPEYAAPEVIDRQPRGSPADMWSLGCVYLNMIVSISHE